MQYEMTAAEGRKEWLLKHMGKGSTGPTAMVAALRRDEDRGELEKIVSPCEWKITWSGTCAAAIEAARRSEAPIVISGRTFPDGGWKDIWGTLRTWKNPPMFILASQLVDESLWSEVLNLGGYGILLKPLHPEEVVRTVHGALMTWRSARKEGAYTGTTRCLEH